MIKNGLKNHTLWGRTYLCSPYKGVPGNPRIDFLMAANSVCDQLPPLLKPSLYQNLEWSINMKLKTTLQNQILPLQGMHGKKENKARS